MGWRNAAVWKWCNLDLLPADNAVSRHELFPVKAPLTVRTMRIRGITDRDAVLFPSHRLWSTASGTSWTLATRTEIT